MAAPLKGVDPANLPWARSIENRLENMARGLSILGYSVGRMPDADKTVFDEFDLGQNINTGTNGKLSLAWPVGVRYASSSGVFEVTVSLAGLVRDGAILGASFESEEVPASIDNQLPKYGVCFTAPAGELGWMPFASSYSTVVSTRPGVQDLSLYLYAECISGTNSAAYVERARLSVKAV